MDMTRPCETVFGMRIDQIRRDRGLTMVALANLAGVCLREIENWTYDRCEPILSYAYTTARALGYNVEDLADASLESIGKPPRQGIPGVASTAFKGLAGTTEFGITLKRALAERSYAKRDFALDIGVSRSSVTNWTCNGSDARLTSAMRAASTLGLSLHALCEGRIEARE